MMTTYLKKTSRIAVYLLFAASAIFFTRCGSTRIPDTGNEESVAGNNIRTYLSEVAKDITDNTLNDIKDQKHWEEQRPARYREFAEMMGIQDYINSERTPLNVKVTGTIQRDGYHIVKLYYESLPGLYVPANLYVPDKGKKQRPGILYVCGHSPTQEVHYQTFPAKYAKLGFVCLIIETIQFGEVRGYHWGEYAKGWFNWYSRGYDPGGVELWNAIRGLDLLASRPEVDPEKLGVTGISGGGSQSWYIAAADPRVKAVAPVCGASTLEAQIGTRTIDGHCDCMMPINTYSIDFQNIGALIAPRPLLICQADRDGLNTIESVRRLYSDIRGVYDVYGKTGNIGFIETPGGHSYHRLSRTGINSFFLKYLMGKEVSPEEAGDIDTSKTSLLTEDELYVYKDGPPADDRTTTIQDSFVSLHKDPAISNQQELVAFRDSVRQFLGKETFGAFPETAPSFDARMEFRSRDGGKFGWKTYSFIPEKGWRLKVDFHWNQDTTKKKPLVIVLRNYNEERWGSESFVSNHGSDWNIAYFEVRGVGETGWDPALQWHVRRASAWTGRTIASMQVYDLLRCLEFCRTLDNVDPAQISIAARDEMTVVALYAALMDGNVQELYLKNPPASQDVASQPDGKGPAIEMLNCLRATDVNEIPALISPTRTEFVGPVPASYNWARDVMKKVGREDITVVEKL